MEFETVIGLEIHVQLNTRSKAFCTDANKFGDAANTNISAVSLAHPGILPVMNIRHIEKAVKLGLALEGNIQQHNLFDRKNYFYPDLPKGYQITQDKVPFCNGGYVSYLMDNQIKVARLHHIHMEEDAGKSVHDLNAEYSLIDFNRAGVPLLEIVTEPEFRSGEEVSAFLGELQKIVQYLDISDANMEEGGFRCDCNVSVRPVGSSVLGERCEIKNLNSRKFAKAAIEFEAARQVSIIESGGHIQKTTMLYDPASGETRLMRKKESENDYRYFTEPDLPPLLLTDDYIESVRREIRALPATCHQKLTNEFGMSPGDADLICDSPDWVDFYFDICKKTPHFKEVTDLLILKMIPFAKADAMDPVGLKNIDEIIDFISFIISGTASKSAVYQKLFPRWIATPGSDPAQLAGELNLLIRADHDFMDKLIYDILLSNSDKVSEYKKGKKGLIGFFMGQVKLKTTGNAVDPTVLKEKLEKALDQ
jgi:aspartyl-tRNA(Asn)/glutamyl-tRNA(Gln) amidotransferase subunit B